MAHGEYKEARGRNFAFVQLLENLPEDWEEIAADKLLPMAFVIHDKDVYTEKEQQQNPEHVQGEPKKAHVHFFVYFNGKRTASGVVEMFSEFGINVFVMNHKSHWEQLICCYLFPIFGQVL